MVRRLVSDQFRVKNAMWPLRCAANESPDRQNRRAPSITWRCMLVSPSWHREKETEMQITSPYNAGPEMSNQLQPKLFSALLKPSSSSSPSSPVPNSAESKVLERDRRRRDVESANDVILKQWVYAEKENAVRTPDNAWIRHDMLSFETHAGFAIGACPSLLACPIAGPMTPSALVENGDLER